MTLRRCTVFGGDRGRRSVFEPDDVAISPAHAYIQHAHLRLGRRSDLWLGMIDDVDFTFGRVDGDGAHRTRIREQDGDEEYKEYKEEYRIKNSEWRFGSDRCPKCSGGRHRSNKQP